MPTRPEVVVAETDDAKLIQQGARRFQPQDGLVRTRDEMPVIPYGYIVQEDGYSVFVPNIESVIARGFFAQVADIDYTDDDEYTGD